MSRRCRGWLIESIDYASNLLIPAIVILHLVTSPFTKVEESFNIQATHDIIAYGVRLQSNDSATHIESHFDHVQFPGSVPRTFVGALLLAGLSQPLVPFLGTIEQAQVLIRAILGLLVSASLILVRFGVDAAYGKVAGRFFVAFITSQFHVMYYASRTLPNIFAFILTNIALALLLQADSTSIKAARHGRKRSVALYCLTVAGVIFRSELAILVLTTTVTMLMRRRASLHYEIIPAGLLGLLVGLTTTVSIDSMFWRQWTWPELDGFYFNTILGKSADWGTSPFYFYFLNAFPRLMLNPVSYLVCIPFAPGLRSTRGISQDTLLPHVAFITIYSLMPHKEWRFVMYSIPAFTAVAAGGAAWIWNRRRKLDIYRWLSVIIVSSIVGSYVVSLALLWISSLNYPGGEALRRLHELETAPKQQVHLDNLACQTGVTRFLQSQPSWIYDKTEDETVLGSSQFWQQFDYVVTEDPKQVPGRWQVRERIPGFAGITLKPDDGEDSIPISERSLLAPVANIYNACAQVIITKLTGGRWPTIKLRTRLYILEQERVGLKDDIKLTIQM